MTAAWGPCICPHCGYDLERDAPITDGRLTFDPRGKATVDGVSIYLQPRMVTALGTLLKSQGRIVPRAVLIERMDDESDGAWINVATVVKRLRRSLEAAGIWDAIETHYGLGYSWRSDACTPTPVAGVTSGDSLGRAGQHDGAAILSGEPA